MAETRELIARNAAKPPFYVGIDLGGTNIKVGVIDDLGRTLHWLTTPTEVERGAEDGSRRMGEAVLTAIAKSGLAPSDVARVGLGSPGFMDLQAGKLLVPANLKGWNYFPLRDRVAHYCGLPVTFANDATAAAYGEFWIGKGREFHSMVLLTLGTGIGCGIVIGDLLLDGEHSLGGEYGHTVIEPDMNARVCGCGQPGHLEAYTSATAVIRRTQEALSAGRTSSIAKRVAAGEELTPKMVSEEAETGDELSREIILETARYLGIAAVNLMHTLDPNGILFGGAMTFGAHQSPVGQMFLDRIKHEIRERAYPLLAQKVVIDFAELGGDAGYIGAAGIARMEDQKKAGC